MDTPQKGTASTAPSREAMETDESIGIETTKRRRPVSRRSRSGRVVATSCELPPRGAPSDAERQILENLKDLVNSSGGLSSEDMVLTVAMVMQEEKRPIIHEALLNILLKTTPYLLQQLVKTHAFLPAVHNWLNLYSKTEQDGWNGVLIQILDLIGKLPLTKEECREEKIKVKRLTQSGATEEIREAASKLMRQWDEKRAKGATLGEGQRRAVTSISRLNSWPKRKVGKAYIAVDPHIKNRAQKLTRRQSGPIATSPGMSSWKPSSPKIDLQKMLKVDEWHPEVTETVNKLRMEQQVEEFAAEGPSQLVHSMETPPGTSVFYAHQRALFAELRSEKVRQSLTPWEDSRAMMKADVPWTEPASTQLPSRDVNRAPMVSHEKDLQQNREKSVPATNSGVLFSSTLETTPAASAPPVFSIPFFPRNEGQYSQQRKILQDAGLRLPSLLGPPVPDPT